MSIYKILNQVKVGAKESLKEVIDMLELEESLIIHTDNLLLALSEVEKDANELIFI